ncbi:MAG: AAA family ATPase [Actinomycetota bacterium]
MTLSPAAFIGREDELSTLIRAVDDHTGPRTWLVAGEAGVGKTRLIEELVARIPTTAVAFGRGACIHTAHSALPFVSVAQAVEALLGQFDPDDVAPAVTSLPELGRVLPDVLSASPTAATADGSIAWSNPEPTQLPVFHALGALLQSLAEIRPVCIVLEDLHWADPSTRDLVLYLADRLVGTRATLLVTYRNDELHRAHPLRGVVADLDRRRAVGHITLGPFNDEELRQLAVERLGRIPAARTLAAVADRSQGNAFFAVELLDAIARGADSIRPELSSLILARVDALSPAAQQVMRIVAVGGESVREELLEVVAELDVDELTACLHDSVDQQVLIVDEDGTLRFRHALVQEAVYSTLLPRERQRVHARYAVALEAHAERSAIRGGSPAELAWHYRESRNPTRAAPAFMAAADVAESQLAFAEALTQLEAVLDLWDDLDAPESLLGTTRDALGRRAAACAFASGDPVRAALLQREAIDVAEEPTATESGVADAQLGRYLWASGRAGEALDVLRRAAELVPAQPPTAERARVLAGLGQNLMLATERDEAERVLWSAIDVARSTGSRRVEGHALNSLGSVLAHNGRYSEGAAMLDQALAIAETEDDSHELLRAYTNYSSAMHAAGYLDECERMARAGLDVAAGYGEEGIFSAFFITSNLADALRDRGRWDEATEALAMVRRPEGMLSALWGVQKGVVVAIRRGEFADAHRVLDQVDPETAHAIDPQMLLDYWPNMCELAIAEGDIAAAHDAVERGLAQPLVVAVEMALRVRGLELAATPTPDNGHLADNGDAAAKGHPATGELADLERLVDEHVADIDHEPRIAALLAEGRAHHATAIGRPDHDLWRAAVEAWERAGVVWETARTRYELAQAALRAGERAVARDELVAVVTVASELGATPLVSAAQQLLQHAGLERNDHGAGHDGTHTSPLTERELDVLRLVADGCTNKQIGEQLFISAKTASVHVSRILAKLAVDNRTEAAAAARRAGLV